jgi:hypothetical protein
MFYRARPKNIKTPLGKAAGAGNELGPREMMASS